MRTKLLGMLTSLALLGGGAALAGDPPRKAQADKAQSDVKTSAQTPEQRDQLLEEGGRATIQVEDVDSAEGQGGSGNAGTAGATDAGTPEATDSSTGATTGGGAAAEDDAASAGTGGSGAAESDTGAATDSPSSATGGSGEADTSVRVKEDTKDARKRSSEAPNASGTRADPQ